MKTLENLGTWFDHPVSTGIGCLDMSRSYEELKNQAFVLLGMLVVMKHHEEITEEEYQALVAEVRAELGKGGERHDH